MPPQVSKNKQLVIDLGFVSLVNGILHALLDTILERVIGWIWDPHHTLLLFVCALLLTLNRETLRAQHLQR